jgi:hypothetical protein
MERYLRCGFEGCPRCRRFYRLVVPWLYREIHSGFTAIGEWAPESIRARKFYQSVKSNPALRPLCRSISISISDTHRKPTTKKGLCDMFRVLNDVVTMLPNITSFSVHGGFRSPRGYSEHTWDMVRNAARCMPHLQTLSINRECDGLYLQQLFESGETWYKLEELTLSGFTRLIGTVTPN